MGGANFYAEAIRREGSLVIVRVDEALFATAEAIMQRHGRIDPTAREKAYRDGAWSEFDEMSVPYSPADVARDRGSFIEAMESIRDYQTFSAAS